MVTRDTRVDDVLVAFFYDRPASEVNAQMRQNFVRRELSQWWFPSSEADYRSEYDPEVPALLWRIGPDGPQCTLVSHPMAWRNRYPFPETPERLAVWVALKLNP